MHIKKLDAETKKQMLHQMPIKKLDAETQLQVSQHSLLAPRPGGERGLGGSSLLT